MYVRCFKYGFFSLLISLLALGSPEVYAQKKPRPSSSKPASRAARPKPAPTRTASARNRTAPVRKVELATLPVQDLASAPVYTLPQPETPQNTRKSFGTAEYAAQAVPVTDVALPNGRYRYRTEWVVNETRIRIQSTVQYQTEADSIRFSEMVDSEWTGRVRDEQVLTRDGRPIRRTLQQGPIRTSIRMRYPYLSGRIEAQQGETAEFDVPIAPGTLLDGAGQWQWLALMPLEKGKSSTFEVFDVAQLRIRQWEWTPQKEELVDAPNGSVPGWIISAHPTDQPDRELTFWVRKSDRLILRISEEINQQSVWKSELQGL